MPTLLWQELISKWPHIKKGLLPLSSSCVETDRCYFTCTYCISIKIVWCVVNCPTHLACIHPCLIGATSLVLTEFQLDSVMCSKLSHPPGLHPSLWPEWFNFSIKKSTQVFLRCLGTNLWHWEHLHFHSHNITQAVSVNNFTLMH